MTTPEPQPEPEPTSSSASDSVHREEAQKRDQAVVSGFAFDTAKIAFFAVIAAFGIYTAFILIGTMFGQFLSGQMRIFATLILCLAIPVLTALGETSDRERFRVVQRRINRITRALIAAAILSCASGALVALAMPNTVVGGLRSNPNWFLSGQMSASRLGEINRKISGTYANLVATTTGALGLYSPSPGQTNPSPKPTTPKGPPAPTRPQNTNPAAGDESDEESGDQRRGRSAIELLKNPPESDEESEEGASGADESGSSGSQDRNSGSYEEW
jgi:hypothetical protein